MIFTASFSVSQSINSINVLTLSDTSQGSDSNIVSRQIFLQTGNGTYLVPSGVTTNFIPWLLANTSIDLNVLSQDYAINILVQWLDINGTVLYSSRNVYLFTAFSEQFMYSLTQLLALKPAIPQDNDYYANKMQLRVLIDSATNAIAIASDISSAQSCLDSAAYLISQKNLFF
jgi:hypothetical protein